LFPGRFRLPVKEGQPLPVFQVYKDSSERNQLKPGSTGEECLPEGKKDCGASPEGLALAVIEGKEKTDSLRFVAVGMD
jgi:hypothetical protein